MQYYHALVTQKSFEFLQKLGQEYKFILIGGWAAFLYSQALKSKGRAGKTEKGYFK